MTKKVYLSLQGLEKLKQQLKELKTIKRKEIAEAIQTAKEHGDISENAEYAEAKEKQNLLEQQIAELEYTIKNAVIIDGKKASKTVVGIGSTVDIECDGQKISFTIVGANEASPEEGKISNESPIGRACFGKKVGDKSIVITPAGKKECKIVKIS